ncbi:MAG TPA: DUF4350 domain-containing protein [Candidatus Acidoferrales bacterium]|nr:DUF4350 domain-containing protein [Candidatus Acidoferrales bacterium]
MPAAVNANLAPADRKALIVVAALFLILMAALFLFGSGGVSTEGFGLPSSYSYGPGGARAGFVLLKEMGYPVQRWEKSPTELPDVGKGTVLILADPAYTPAAEERQALVRFLRTGGRILATGWEAATEFLPDGRAVPGAAWPGETHPYEALLPSPITIGADDIELVPEGHWISADPTQLALYGSEREPVVVTYEVGQGRVVWWASAWPMTNFGIGTRENMVFFLNSVGVPHGATVLWDEYFHGERGSLWAFLRTTPVPWAGVQLLLFGAALVATFGRRWGPVRPPRKESRHSPLEFVETLGGLYESAHAGGPAVGVALKRFRFLLTRRLGLPTGYPAEELGSAARVRLGADAEGLAELLTAAETAAVGPPMEDDAALHMVQGLHGYAEALRLLPGRTESRRTSGKSGEEAS